MVRQITLYETDDGKTFNSKEDAQEHQNICALADWLSEKAALPASDDGNVDWYKIAKALRDNPEILGI